MSYISYNIFSLDEVAFMLCATVCGWGVPVVAPVNRNGKGASFIKYLEFIKKIPFSDTKNIEVI